MNIRKFALLTYMALLMWAIIGISMKCTRTQDVEDWDDDIDIRVV